MCTPERFANAERELLEAARAQSGLVDFGDDNFRPGLRALLQAMDEEIQFTPSGRQFGAGTIIGTLASRLHAQAGWTRYPDCLKVPLKRPLVITGIPRTGTTALHQLLSLDPQFQGLEHWLTDTPMPRPKREYWLANPHFQATQAGLDAFFNSAPEMRVAHLITAHDVDECLEVLKLSFVSNRFSSGWNVPSYAAWHARQDERPAYRYYANVLRLIGWGDERPWLLKNPGHIAQLGILFDTFPDACVVQTHRSPVETLPSLCSVLAMSRRVLEGDAVDVAAIGPREMQYWSTAVRKAMLTRAQHARQVFDVDHRKLRAEPLSVVRDIYAHFELTLDADTERTMRAWVAANPSTRNGKHQYSLDHFQLDANEIREAFRDYMSYFNL